MRHAMLSRTTAIAGLASALLLAPLGSAHAARPGGGGSYNPTIAYQSNQGTTNFIVLMNADGSNPVQVYSSKASQSSPGRLDFVPGSGPQGGRLVFSDRNSIKLLSYTVSSSGIKTTSVQTLATESNVIRTVDVSPDAKYILYVVSNGTSDAAGTIAVMPIQGGTASLVDSGGYGSAVWSRNGRDIAVVEGLLDGQLSMPRIEMLTLNPPDDPDHPFGLLAKSDPIFGPCSGSCTVGIEFAHTQDTVLYGVSGQVFDVQASGGSLEPYPAINGFDPCFDSNDARIFFKNATGSPLLSVYDVAAGVITTLTTNSVRQFDVLPPAPATIP